MKKLIILPILAFFLFGCATQNTPGTTDYNEVQTSISNKNGNIIVKRDNGFMGSLLSANIFIDNKMVAPLDPGDFIRIQLEGGVHFISVSSAKSLNLGTAFERSIRIEIADNMVRTFRVFPMPTQGIVIEEIAN